MAGDAELHRDIGRLEGDVNGLKDQVAQLRLQNSDMQGKIDAMHDAIMAAKGGWKMLVIVGSIGAAVAALVTKVIGWMTGSSG